ncbi:MAG: nucleoside triphosphate pyrophosphohydrolase [Patescibacteria group bacterium]
MKYNKLVRDKIPQIIKQKRETAVVHVASKNEYWQKLKEKLLEEVGEFNKDENMEEIADILEVLDAVIAFKKFDRRKILKIKKQKFAERGGFKKRIILVSTD